MLNFLINVFNVILYRPLFNALVLLYQYLPGRDFGIAVILLTILIRVIFYPLMVRSIKSQKVLSDLQPKIQDIQNKYNGDREKQTKEIILLYQKEKINPFGGLFFILIQLPILIALYQVFWRGLQPEAMVNLYTFVPHPGVINPFFLRMINLAQPSLVLAFFAGVFQFFQNKMITPHQRAGDGQASKKKDQMAQFSNLMQKQMLYFFPIFTVFILWRLPSAIGLYWIVTTLFSIGQQHLIFKKEHVKSN